MHSIYAFNNGGEPGFLQVLAVGDDGVPITHNICSDVCFMKADIGVTTTRQHDRYDAHFGAGNWKLEWVDHPDTHEGFQKAWALALARNEAEASNHAH